MKGKGKELEHDLADVIIEKPFEFTVGRKHLRLYPVTLAKTLMLGRYMDELDIDTDLLDRNPYLEAIRLVHRHRDLCATIIAIHTAPNTYRDLFDLQALRVRRNLLKKAGSEDLATLLVIALTSDKTAVLSSHFGITEERERMAAVARAKKSRNSLSFGGKTIFGSFIAPLHEMGYSDSEILYERGYSYLRMMLADKMTEVYLTDEELEGLPASVGGRMLDGNDPASLAALKERLGSRGVKFND